MRKVKLEDIKNSHGTTNWSELKRQTDADIEKAAKCSDAKLLTEHELSQFYRNNSEQGAR